MIRLSDTSSSQACEVPAHSDLKVSPGNRTRRFPRSLESLMGLGKWLAPILARLRGFRGPSRLSARLAERGQELERVSEALSSEIAQRKHAQLKIQESERRYEEFFAELPLAILEEDWRAVKQMLDALVAGGVSDLHRYFLENPDEVGRAYELADRFGVTDAAIRLYRAESRQQFMDELCCVAAGPDELSGYRDTMLAFYAGETSYEYEAEEIACDDTPIQTRIRFALPPSGRAAWRRVLVTMEDITEARATETRLRQAQKMEAVGQLTGGIAHDFNNLLSVIHGNAELLCGEPGIDASLTTPILRASERGSELTQRLLAFSRQQPLRPQAIDIANLIGELRGMLERTLGESIEIHTVLAPGLWFAQADSGQVENAILNLALNARDAMPDGGSLRMECSNVSSGDFDTRGSFDGSEGDFLKLEVVDTGTGMSEEVRTRACEPFFTTKEVGEGSGLGLSMIYGFARQSGGHLEVHSEPGEGTRVVLYLPRAGEEAQRDGSREDPRLRRGHGETILVLEDDPDVRGLSARMLRGLGYRVLEAWDARTARSALARDDSVDLVLSDVVLPGGASGPEFCREAGVTHPGLKFLFMSGHPAKAGERIPILAEDSALLRKPFGQRELALALRVSLGG